MQSILLAIYDLISNFIKDNKKEVLQKEDKVPAGYKPFFFYCWLCKGITRFACKKTIKNRTFTIDCSHCGIENSVIIEN